MQRPCDARHLAARRRRELDRIRPRHGHRAAPAALACALRQRRVREHLHARCGQQHAPSASVEHREVDRRHRLAALQRETPGPRRGLRRAVAHDHLPHLRATGRGLGRRRRLRVGAAISDEGEDGHHSRDDGEREADDLHQVDGARSRLADPSVDRRRLLLLRRPLTAAP